LRYLPWFSLAYWP